MEVEISCGICDFYIHSTVENVAQIEFINNLFVTTHSHPPEEIRLYIESQSGVIISDGSPTESPTGGDDDQDA